jgi:PAS domain S-box-containing protein
VTDIRSLVAERPETDGPEEAPPPAAGAEFFLPFQRMPIPVHSMGPDGLLLEVNEAWANFTGYGKTEAIGKSFGSFLDPPSAARYRQKAVPEMINAVPDKESRSVEYRLIKASGETVDVVLTARPERDPLTGRFLHSLTVINDVTARNRAEAALRQALKLEALGSLTSGVAHDFNNLLMIILGSLQLLSTRLPSGDARAARLVDAAVQGARRGAALTARLLAFARQQELSPVPLDPAKLLVSLRPMLSHLLGPGIRIEEDLPDGLWNLRADPNQLELALLNLAANARDAMPEGGRLGVAARNATVAQAESAFIGTGTQPEGQHVVLTVRDTGTGMDEVALARAADPFFTTKGPGKGTGLGLSMVHGFAVQSGGALLLSSRPGEGTVVEIWLPRTTEPVIEAEIGEATAAHAIPSEGRSLRILLVDDDPLVVAGTTGMLEELGHDAIQAVSSGEEALAVLRQNGDFDVLLTDHMMPGMSGTQLAAQARVLHPSLPILLASGFAELDGASGATWPRLRKPYGLNDLAAALALLQRQPRRSRGSTR